MKNRQKRSRTKISPQVRRKPRKLPRKSPRHPLKKLRPINRFCRKRMPTKANLRLIWILKLQSSKEINRGFPTQRPTITPNLVTSFQLLRAAPFVTLSVRSKQVFVQSGGPNALLSTAIHTLRTYSQPTGTLSGSRTRPLKTQTLDGGSNSVQWTFN